MKFAIYSLCILFICAVGVLIYSAIKSALPEIIDIQEIKSPDGKKSAYLYAKSGGGAAGSVVTAVSILPADEEFTDSTKYRVMRASHVDQITISWIDSQNLLISLAYHGIFKPKSSIKNIKIEYNAYKITD